MGGQISACFLAVTGTQPFVRSDEAEEGFWGEELAGACVEELVEVASAGKGFQAGVLIEFAQFAVVFLELDIRRIAEDDVKAMSEAEHVFGIELIGLGVWVVEVPIGGEAGQLELLDEFFSECFVSVPALAFGVAGAGGEVLFVVGGELGLEMLDGGSLGEP